MQWYRWAMGLVLLAGVGLAGCGGEGGVSTGPGGGLFARGQDAPSGEGGFTVLLMHFNDPLMHAQMARDYRRRVEEGLGWRGVFVVVADDHSELFWGRFHSPAQAAPTLRKAKAHRAANGLPVFAKAMIVPLPSPPVGPPDWALKNNPGTYSLLVALYKSDWTAKPPYRDADRQNDAVLHCQQLREQGHEAWYHHGASASSVTIGSFGRDAVRLELKPVPQPNQNEPVFAETSTIVDPRLEALQQQFDKLAVNGRESFMVTRDAQGRQVERTPERTYVIRVEQAR